MLVLRGRRARAHRPPAAPLEIDNRAYRGAIEVFGNAAAR